nr:immunoglobulin light chain junction region [Macaca mulatta]
CQTYITSPLTF